MDAKLTMFEDYFAHLRKSRPEITLREVLIEIHTMKDECYCGMCNATDINMWRHMSAIWFMHELTLFSYRWNQ